MQALIEQLKIPVLTVVISILFIYLISKIFGPFPLSINSTVTNTQEMFTSTGTGEASGTPEKASFTVGVTNNGTTAQDAQTKLNETVNKVTAALKEQDIDEENIKTSEYSINPNTDFTDSRQTITGYTGTTTLVVTIDEADKANAALDIATKNGANIVSGVSFVLDDEDREELEDEARGKAIADAKKKAAKISSQAGIRLGRVTGIVESNSGNPQIPYDRLAMSSEVESKDAAITQLEAGENKVKITVTLTYDTN